MRSPAMSRRSLARLALLGLGTTALAGCDSLDGLTTLLDRPPPPLPGQRTAVFPNGVQRDTSVPQPMNAPDPEPPPMAAEPAQKKKPRRQARAARPAPAPAEEAPQD
jgi:hypothetical protein